MKSNKGITLVSLLIYMIVLALVIGIVSTFTKYFYANTEEALLSDKTSEQYTLFLSYITDDINSGKIDTVEVEADGMTVNFYFLDNSIHQYAFDEDNKKVYYVLYDSEGTKQKQIALCKETDEGGCAFSYEGGNLNVKITINSITYNNSFTI